MTRGFYTIMLAQFFSSLADNALFVTAVELLRTDGAPEWQRTALVPMFALFYVVLAPFVGAFADSMPKGRVMFISNAIKMVGCVMMLCGSHPLLSYAVVGLGAAAYSPAKYGILTELLPASQLVKANGWIEGLTITSVILGVVLGGQLVGPRISGVLLGLDVPGVDLGIDLPAEAAIMALIPVYALAALFNLRIPRAKVQMRPMPRNFTRLLRDFRVCNARLWRDKLGQISLSTTTLFWGASGNLRYIVLAWGAAAMGYGVTEASRLLVAVAIGTAVGAVLASALMRLHMATRVLPLGIAMGLLVILMNFVSTIGPARGLLVVMGGLGGFLVVPMNALLQHRGHNLMGAGRSIAVQNFNEQAAILGMGALYSLSTRFGLSAFGAITAFGATVAGVMGLIAFWHAHNRRHHGEEVAHQISIARRDN